VSVEALAATQNGTADPVAALAELDAILDLPAHGLAVRAARIVGRGARASADLRLSDGTTVEFESVRDLGNAPRLRLELAAQAGVAPKLKPEQAIRLVVLVRAIADHEVGFTADDVARDWGMTYLQAAQVLDLDLSDQRARWAAFHHLSTIEPAFERNAGRGSVAAASVVLRHQDGSRYVRCGWFRAHVRAEDSIAATEIAHRMQRVGWHRRGATGRIKATNPSRPNSLAWSFFTVPDGWEAQP
jgi:hypothetical protein